MRVPPRSWLLPAEAGRAVSAASPGTAHLVNRIAWRAVSLGEPYCLMGVRPMRGRQRKPKSTLAGRLVRGRRLDRNPLRRATDRAETLVLVLLAAVFLVAAPLVAAASGRGAHATAQRAELAQAASRYQASAVVLAKPARPVAGSASLVSIAKARWTAPDGAVVTRGVLVPVDTAAGARLSIWTTRDGQPAPRPLNGSQVASVTLLGEAAGVAALAIVLVLGGVLARWSLNRHRLAA